ncbi:MAG: hypothetical protein ABI629_02960 [bacterium]
MVLQDDRKLRVVLGRRARAFRTAVAIVAYVGLGLHAAEAYAAAAIDTYVGGGNGDGGFAYDATIDPRGLTLSGSPAAPDIYVADGRNHRIRRIDGETGLIETVAGGGTSGFAGDGGNALNAKLNLPLDVAQDSAGNLYIADLNNNRIRKVTPNGQISTFAGNGNMSYSGDNGLATQAALYNPYGVAVGPDGYVYIADFGNNRIRRVGPAGCTPSSCIITTVVGTGVSGFAGDNGPALSAVLRNPADVSFDPAGNMLIADWTNHRIRKVVNGIINTVAGGGYTGIPGQIGDGGLAIFGVLKYPTQVSTDSAGNLYIADSLNYRIRMVQATTQIITTVAGTGVGGATGDGGPAVNATLYATWGVGASNPGEYWISASNDLAKSQYNRVRHVVNTIIYPWAGGGLGDGGAAYDALVNPRGVFATRGSGSVPDIYFADGVNNVVRWVDGETGAIHNIAGTGEAGYSGDDGPATRAKLHVPLDVAVDNAGNVYFADTSNNVVRKINANGYISTVAGDGTRGNTGDGGPATQAKLASPTGIALDRNGTLYIADNENNRIRVVSKGTISTVAGNGQSGYSGDGAAATAAMLRNPFDIVVADDGTLFISDTWNHRIRRVSDGVITTYAGTGLSGFAGDGSAAKDSKINAPSLLSIDSAGRLFISDSRNLRIRMIEPSTQVITTIAGNGSPGVSGDGGPATSASFSEPSGVAIDPETKALFISSMSDSRIRIVDLDLIQGPQATATYTATAIPSTAIPSTPTSVPATPTRTPTRTPTNAQTPTRTSSPTRTPTGGGQPASVLGAVRYYNGQAAVPGVQMYLKGPLPSVVQTNSQGNYDTGQMAQGTWTVEPAKQGGFGNAVSSLDAARVLQVVAGLTTFNDSQRLACDTTGDGSLSTLDAVRILQFSAGVISRFPVATACGSDWVFIPTPEQAANQDVTPPLIASGTCQGGAITLRSLSTEVDNQNFTGILFGDCTGNWTQSAAAALRQTANQSTVIAGRPHNGRNHIVRIPIYVRASGTFQALDLRLRFGNEAKFVAALPRGGAAKALISQRSADGSITLSLASAQPVDPTFGAVLVLEFRVPSAAQLAASLVTAAVDEQPARPVTQRR